MSRSGKQTHSPGEVSISVRGDRNQPKRVMCRAVANKCTCQERRRSGSAATGIRRHVVLRSGSPGEASISVHGDRNQEACSIAQWPLAQRGVDRGPRRQESGGA